jgi:hypothetical protein
MAVVSLVTTQLPVEVEVVVPEALQYAMLS